MKKNIVRGSMLTVATLSILLGGTSYTSNVSVKEQITETPVIISKAIKNSNAETTEIAKGNIVQEVAQATTEQQEDAETVELETKEAKVESNQVVANIESYLNIREEASEEAEVVGKFYTGNVGTMVEQGEEWSLVSSGNAYGYVKNEYLLLGEEAENYIENNCDQVAKVTADTLNVRAEETTESEIITLSDHGDTLTVLGQENGWFKVAVSTEEVGYVSGDYVYIDYIYETAVTIEEEEAALAAQAEREAAEAAEREAQAAAQAQAATTTTQSPSTEAPKTEAPKTETPKTEAPAEVVTSEEGTATGQAIANYAVQFVGNPYKYGGTSLTDGADCSGFVQSVYKNFGYTLPRTAASQSGAGTSVSTSSLQPGDLLFYHGYGHVAIYIGGGQVVHASNQATGIKISSYNYSPIDKAVRIVK